DRTMLGCRPSVPTHLPQDASHNLTVLSQLPEATRLPSGLKATGSTKAVWPLRVAGLPTASTSHSLIVLSALPEASSLPSGLKATHRTTFACPVRVARFAPATAPHNFTV